MMSCALFGGIFYTNILLKNIFNCGYVRECIKYTVSNGSHKSVYVYVHEEEDDKVNEAKCKPLVSLSKGYIGVPYSCTFFWSLKLHQNKNFQINKIQNK